MRTPPSDITQLLRRWNEGDRAALDQLMPVVYQELRKLAAGYLREERPDHTLQPTALINEAYLRLVRQDFPEWQSRKHFYGVAAQLMRQVLVEHARARATAKRGGGAHKLSLDEAPVFSQERDADLVALDEALTALAKFDERKARVVELRYFGGLSVEEVAGALDISAATVGREMRMAQAWLRRELNCPQVNPKSLFINRILCSTLNLSSKNKAMGSLTIAKDGKVLYTRAIGYSQINGTEKKPLTAANRFRIASITKMFTAAIILQLVEEGKLKLTDTLDKFFPQIPNARKITIVQMLSHRSGIPNVRRDQNKYVGVYSSPGVPVKWTITRDGGTLFFRPPGAQSAVPLEATAEDKFQIEGAAVFEFDAAKNQLIIKRRGGQKRVLTKEK